MLTLFEKVFRAFVVAFLGVFLPGIAGWLNDIANGGHWSAARSALIALAAAGVAAGVRAVIAYLPLFADDNAFGLSRRV